MARKTLLTLEQFFTMPENGHKYELVHGELIEMPPNEYIHESVKANIAEALSVYLRGKRLGRVFPETGAVLDPESWRVPDVCYFRKERLAKQERNQPLQGAADLCVEVVSPSNTNKWLAEKAEHYLSTGASVVWIAYPATREVHVITKSGDRWLGPDDMLTEPGLLPGFEVRVGSLFEDEPL